MQEVIARIYSASGQQLVHRYVIASVCHRGQGAFRRCHQYEKFHFSTCPYCSSQVHERSSCLPACLLVILMTRKCLLLTGL